MTSTMDQTEMIVLVLLGVAVLASKAALPPKPLYNAAVGKCKVECARHDQTNPMLKACLTFCIMNTDGDRVIKPQEIKQLWQDLNSGNPVPKDLFNKKLKAMIGLCENEASAIFLRMATKRGQPDQFESEDVDFVTSVLQVQTYVMKERKLGHRVKIDEMTREDFTRAADIQAIPARVVYAHFLRVYKKLNPRGTANC